MVKKVLSCIVLSATLFSPALADDFVPLQYYDNKSLPIIQTKPTYQYEERSAMGRGLYGDTSIDMAIRQAILNKDRHELEFLLFEVGLSYATISTIVDAMENGDEKRVLDMVEAEISNIKQNDYEWCHNYCERKLDSRDLQSFPYTNCMKQCLGKML